MDFWWGVQTPLFQSLSCVRMVSVIGAKVWNFVWRFRISEQRFLAFQTSFHYVTRLQLLCSCFLTFTLKFLIFTLNRIPSLPTDDWDRTGKRQTENMCFTHFWYVGNTKQTFSLWWSPQIDKNILTLNEQFYSSSTFFFLFFFGNLISNIVANLHVCKHSNSFTRRKPIGKKFSKRNGENVRCNAGESCVQFSNK